MERTNISSLLQRYEALEEKAGITIRTLSAFSRISTVGSKYRYEVRGEVIAIEGSNIERNVNIDTVFYDHQGHIFDRVTNTIWADSFIGIHFFSSKSRAHEDILGKIVVTPSDVFL